MQPRLLREHLRLAGAPILRLQSDERLVALTRAGNHPGFAELVQRYRPALVRYATGIVGTERAEDAVQVALANAHRALMADDRPVELRPWLYRIVHNAALNVLRGEPEVIALPDPADGTGELPALDGVVEQVERRERLRSTLRAVQALPAVQRDAILLREIEGRSHVEIAEALGVTAGAARQHLTRARTTLRAVVTAVTPYPLLLRLVELGAAQPAVGGAAVEAAAGLGLGAVLTKLGAGALVTGALVGGVGVVQPDLLPGRGPGPAAAAAGADRGEPARREAPAVAGARATPPGPAGPTRATGTDGPDARAAGGRDGRRPAGSGGRERDDREDDRGRDRDREDDGRDEDDDGEAPREDDGRDDDPPDQRRADDDLGELDDDPSPVRDEDPEPTTAGSDDVDPPREIEAPEVDDDPPAAVPAIEDDPAAVAAGGG